VRSCPACGLPLTAADATGAPPSITGPPVALPPLHPTVASRRRGPHWLRWALTLSILLIFALAIFPLPQLGLWGNPGCGFPGTTCTRVLFIGNSYTSVNDLPTTFADLAWSGGHRVQTDALDEGGWTLAQHATAAETATALRAQRWDFVVLQEQSQIPSLPVDRTDMMDPAATRLVQMVRAQHAQPMFYLTFAHQDGWPQEGLPDYQSMQSAIDDGYLQIAGQLGVPIVPVGAAWETVADGPSPPSLWQSDGSHPTVSGTYLAACVFYAAIFHASPVGLSDDDGLGQSQAHSLQTAAASTVMGDPAEWGLPG
jgi:hypothetical protein